MKVSILTLPGVQVKIFQIRHVIFQNRKSVFFQILHDFLVSGKVTPRYIFRLNVIYFAQKGPVKVQIFETFECSDQNLPKSCHF